MLLEVVLSWLFYGKVGGFRVLLRLDKMRIGYWKSIRWAKCIGIALYLFVIIFFATCTCYGLTDGWIGG